MARHRPSGDCSCCGYVDICLCGGTDPLPRLKITLSITNAVTYYECLEDLTGTYILEGLGYSPRGGCNFINIGDLIQNISSTACNVGEVADGLGNPGEFTTSFGLIDFAGSPTSCVHPDQSNGIQIRINGGAMNYIGIVQCHPYCDDIDPVTPGFQEGIVFPAAVTQTTNNGFADITETLEWIA